MAVTGVAPDSAMHRTASDPAASVWVSASAGTGKTRSLVDRITRLLLAGAAPSSLLAITFTKTAAAEMQKRVLERLAAWSGLDDAALAGKLLEIGEAPTADALARARALFLDVLDAPDGLQVRTIHAMAQSLLAAFPLEAGLPPRVDPLDERSAARLRSEALRLSLEDARRQDGLQLRADFERIAVEEGEGALATRLPMLLKGAEGFRAIGAPQAVEPWLKRWLGLPVEGALSAMLEAAVVPPAFDDAAVSDYAAVLAVARRNDKESAMDLIAAWPDLSPAARVEAIPRLIGLVRDSKGKRRATATIAKTDGALERFDRLFEAVDKVIERQRAVSFIDHAGAWIRVGMAVSGHYRRLKTASATVDFDDMVADAARLLEAEGMASFVARKLDRRIGHVLVDEAQDTNPEQWRLIDGLTADFDSGEGAHEAGSRTRFVVGDFKQAIYRFQGTDPELFFDVRKRWGERAAAAGQPIDDVPLSLNFRSAPIILRLVDAVLEALGPEAIGLPAGAPLPAHAAKRADLPGRLILLPPHVRSDPGNGEEEAPEEEIDTELADPAYADRIASAIAALIDPASSERVVVTPREGPPRPAGPGDVLILLQARGDLMAELVRALHARGLPVAGVDRARLMEPLAVRDLLSLMRFAVQPGDDLALAELLTSPLGGVDHETVRQARLPRGSLWEGVLASADPRLAPAQDLLRRALAMADFAGPHGFLQAVLVAGGRAAFRRRLGREADDGIDMLLAEALAFEADNPATLQGFLRHVGGMEDAIGRDPDASPGLIRIMSIHGAKGLEAPIVVLADALRQRKRDSGAVTVTLDDGRASLPLVYGNGARKPAAVAALAAERDLAEEEEHNRLLYVALTRAEQVLLVAGQVSAKQAESRRKAGEEGRQLDSWHDRIGRAMRSLGAVEADAAPFGQHLRLSEGDWPAPGMAAAAAAAIPIPPWALQPPPPEPAPARPYTPSQPAGDEAPLKPASPGQAAAAARGRLLHRLFEKLPAVPEAARERVARRVIAASGHDGEAADAILADVMATLGHPDAAPLFGEGALAEAPVAGVVDGLVIAGTVDRLLVTEEEVLVADFKTGLAVPETAESAHPSHLRQIAAYRAVLRAAFPGRQVRAALVFTAAPKFLLLPDKLLDAHAPVA
jgi:ATP-dependent helicase/nuclease subunit A